MNKQPASSSHAALQPSSVRSRDFLPPAPHSKPSSLQRSNVSSATTVQGLGLGLAEGLGLCGLGEEIGLEDALGLGDGRDN